MFKIPEKKKKYIIVGSGGTGSWLASFMSKLDEDVTLIDGDVVEQKNLIRQNFFEDSINLYKSEALANTYSHSYITEFLSDTEILDELCAEFTQEGYIPVIVGCLDNNGSRALIHEVFVNPAYPDLIWIDSGNAERHGQTYVSMKFNNELILPSPLEIDEALQNTDGDERRPDEISCAEQSESAPQNVTANVMAATSLFNIINIINTNGLLMGNKFTFNTLANTISTMNTLTE